MSDNQVWQQVCDLLRCRVSTASFHTWVEPLRLQAVEDERVVVSAETQYALDHIAKRLMPEFRQAFGQVLGRSVQVELLVRDIDNAHYKNYNLAKASIYKPAIAGSNSSGRSENYKNYKGLYAAVHSEPLLLEAQSWGVCPKMIYSCCRDYDMFHVKEAVVKIKRLADSYFRKTEPVLPQRGRLFTNEMKNLRKALAAKA